MAAITFDTLKFVEALKESGFNDIQAKGMSDAIKSMQAEGLVTKSDLLEAKTEIKLEMADIRAEFKIMKWMLTLTLAGVAGILTLLLKLVMH